MNCNMPGLPVHHQLPEFTQTHVHRVRWCHPAISSSVVPFSSCPQSLPASGSFPMSQLFAWGGQSTGVSASASIPPMNTQDWSPLGWTGGISLQSKGLSRVFSNTLSNVGFANNFSQPDSLFTFLMISSKSKCFQFWWSKLFFVNLFFFIGHSFSHI